MMEALSKDEKEIPIDDSGSPIKNDKGEVFSVVLVFREITKGRLAEHSLRHQITSSLHSTSSAQSKDLAQSSNRKVFQYSPAQPARRIRVHQPSYRLQIQMQTSQPDHIPANTTSHSPQGSKSLAITNGSFSCSCE